MSAEQREELKRLAERYSDAKQEAGSVVAAGVFGRDFIEGMASAGNGTAKEMLRRLAHTAEPPINAAPPYKIFDDLLNPKAERASPQAVPLRDERQWQHDETGRMCELDHCPGPRWFEVPSNPKRRRSPECNLQKSKRLRSSMRRSGSP
jgi:hypothetical protein